MNQNMDTVFDAAKEFDNDFDVIFDREDQLIDTVNGVNEAGDPLTGVDFEDLHQEETDDVKKADFEQPDEDDGNKHAEGTDEKKIPDNADIEKETASDADKAIEDVDKDYQDTDNSSKGVEDTVTGTIDNDSDVECEAADLDDMLLGADDEYQKTIPSDSGVENTVTGTIDNDKEVQSEAVCEKCKKEGCSGDCEEEKPVDEACKKESDEEEVEVDDSGDAGNTGKIEEKCKKESVETEACKKENNDLGVDADPDVEDMLLADLEEEAAPEGTTDKVIPDNADIEKSGESDTDKLIDDVDKDYQDTDNSSKGVEDTVTGTVDNDKDVQCEASEADADVENVVDSEDDEDEALIDDLSGADLTYEPSDEDLIDAAINGTI